VLIATHDLRQVERLKRVSLRQRTGGRHGAVRMISLRHAQVLLATLGQMTKSPLATLLTLTVIGITLACRVACMSCSTASSA
jgi:hypothetical protein